MKEKIILIGSAGNLGMYMLDYLQEHIDFSKYEIIATGTKKEYPFEFYNGQYISSHQAI